MHKLQIRSFCFQHRQALWQNCGFVTQHDRQTLRQNKNFRLTYLLESCAGRVNPRGLRVPTFAGRVREHALLCVWVRGGCGLNLLRGGCGIRNSSCGQMSAEPRHMNLISSRIAKHVKTCCLPAQGFFPRGAVGDFSKIFCRGAKSGEICFLRLEIEKTIFFANNFKIQGRPCPPPFRRPCCQHCA